MTDIVTAVSTLQASITNIASVGAGAVLAVIGVALVIWGIMWVVRKLRSGASAGAGK